MNHSAAYSKYTSFCRLPLLAICVGGAIFAHAAPDEVWVQGTYSGRTSSRAGIGFSINCYIHNSSNDTVYRIAESDIQYSVPPWIDNSGRDANDLLFFYIGNNFTGGLTPGVHSLGDSTYTDFFGDGFNLANGRYNCYYFRSFPSPARFHLYHSRLLTLYTKDSNDVVTERDSVRLIIDIDLEIGYDSSVSYQTLGPGLVNVHLYAGEKPPSPRPEQDAYRLPSSTPDVLETLPRLDCRTRQAQLGSVNYSIPLGVSEFGDESGFLRLAGSAPLDRLYQPKSLIEPTARGFTKIGGTNPTQFFGPNVVCNVDDPNTTDNTYQLKLYHRDPSAVPNPDGSIPVTGDPYATYTVENPDTAGSTRLRITKSQENELTSVLYAYNQTTDTWTLEDAANDRVEELQHNEDQQTGDYDEVRVVKNTAGNPTTIAKVKTTFHRFDFGVRKIREIVDPDPGGKNLTTTWTYYDNASTDGDNYRKVKLVTGPTGNWKLHTYQRPASDKILRPLKVVSQFLDAPSTATDAESRVVETTVNPSGTPSGSTLTVEKLLGQEVGRTYWIKRPDGHDDVVATQAGAAWNATSNLITEYRKVTDGQFAGKIHSIRRPDGTKTIYSYSVAPTGDLVTIRDQGVPGSVNPDQIVDGTHKETHTNPQGYVFTTLVTDIASGLTVDQSTASQADAFGRPTTTQRLGGTETRSYDCCGLSSFTDVTGLTASFTRNGIQKTATLQGIAEIEDFPGRTQTVTRRGTDQTEMQLSLREFNQANQVIRTVDAAGREVGYAETVNANGYRIVTASYPDGGTRIETFYPDGQLSTITGDAVYPVKIQYGIDPAEGRFRKTIRLGSQGEETEWTTSYFDVAGRVVKTVTAHESGNPAVVSLLYNAQGQIARSTDADGVTTLFEYNAKGERTAVAIDVNRNGAIDRNGTDRITETATSVAVRDGKTVRRTRESQYLTENSATGTELRVTESSVDGLDSWVTTAALTTHSHTALPGGGIRTVTVTFPDGTQEIATYQGNRRTSLEQRDNTSARVTRATLAYDPHGRVSGVNDDRTGPTGFTWYPDDQVASVTTPPPGDGGGAQTTTYSYDLNGRLDQTTLPDQAVVDRDYSHTGDLSHESGARTYGANYSYDSQGRLKTMLTPAGTTTWNYFAQSGRLEQKLDGHGAGPSFTYTAAGRLLTRQSGRPITSTYSYTNAGDLGGISYSDSTPAAAYTYTRRGQIASVAREGSTTAYTYNLAGQLELEQVDGGVLDAVVVDPAYDDFLRRTSLAASGTGWTYQQTYGYDAAGRLNTLTQGDHSVQYGYLSNSNLLQTIRSLRSGTAVLTTFKTWDMLNRLHSIGSASASFHQDLVYTYNAANQRQRATREDGSYWDYQYGAQGQLTGATQHYAPGQSGSGYQFGYTYDTIGDRTQATVAGPGGGSSHAIGYTPAIGDATQYASISHSGKALVTGKANPSASVTVNGAAAAVRQTSLFAHELTLTNGSGPAALPVTVNATLGTDTETSQRQAFVPAASATQQYDADGNLIFDGWLDYTWDAEGRLIGVASRPSLVPPGSTGLQFRQEISYDHVGRRIQRKTFTTTNGTESLTAHDLFVFDGWNQIAVLDGTTGLPRQTYVWGLDLSQTTHGAGGVGGLALINDVPSQSSHFVPYDGNGNVTALVNSSTGAASARYQYDPFGNLLASEGPFAEANPWRFSTKPVDRQTGFYNYGYRFYNPVVGRWLSRDPIGEDGGLNLYGFVGNDAISGTDVLGLTFQEWVIDRVAIAKSNHNDVAAWAGIMGYALWDAASFGAMGRREILEQALQNGQISTNQYWKGQLVNGALSSAQLALVAGSGGTGGVGLGAGWVAKGGSILAVAGRGAAMGALIGVSTEGGLILGDELMDFLAGLPPQLTSCEILERLVQAGLIGAVTGGISSGALKALEKVDWKALAKALRGGGAASSGASNAAAYQAYKDSLRAAMSKPAVTDPKLAGLLDELYRQGASVGSGSTAAAVRHELATGAQVGGRTHTQKAQNFIDALAGWLKNNPTARGGDRAAAENVMQDMINALNGK